MPLRYLQNCMADALSNMEFDGFDPNQRIEVPHDNMQFKVLDEMAAVSNALYLDVESRKKLSKRKSPTDGATPTSTPTTAEEPTSSGKKSKEDRLRIKDPWQ